MDQIKEYKREFSLLETLNTSLEIDETRKEFLKKTYITMCYGILIFIGFFSILYNTVLGVKWTTFIFGLGKWTLLILYAIFGVTSGVLEELARQSEDEIQKWVFYALFNAIAALMYFPVLGLVFAFIPGILVQSLILTVAIVGSLTFYVLKTKKDLSFLKGFVTTGLIALFITIIASFIFNFQLGLGFTLIVIVILCGSILYETYNVVHFYREDEYIPAAMRLLFDVYLLFYYIVMFLLERDN